MGKNIKGKCAEAAARVETVALCDIYEAPWNTRSEITEASVRALAESIRADGLLQPPNAIANTLDGRGGYICFDGCRRVAALRLNGAETASVRIWDITTDEAKVKTVTANIQREDDDPLLAAKVIGELLAAGHKPEQIASKLGKTTPWVRRRAKLCALATEVAEKIVGKVTLDALEKIAVMPDKAQRNLVKAVERRASYANGALVTAADIRWDIQREQADLDAAPFCADGGCACAKCEKRTGCQPDLWGETDGGLGKCLDAKCFAKTLADWQQARVAALVPEGAETVRVAYDWQMPADADSPKPTKRKPCAFVFFGSDGKPVVKYGMSQAAREAEEAAREAEREAANAEREAERKRAHDINGAFTDAMVEKEKEAVALARAAVEKPTNAQAAWIAALVADGWRESWSDRDCAEILRTFPALAALCGIPKEDAKWYCEQYAD